MGFSQGVHVNRQKQNAVFFAGILAFLSLVGGHGWLAFWLGVIAFLIAVG
jgi:hypothetical protein